MSKTPRTEAGTLLRELIGTRPEHNLIDSTLLEGEKDTAMCWVTNAAGEFFQVHITKLEPNHAELAWLR